MECSHCRGRMVRGSAPLSIDRDGYQIHWNAIPAWVCSQCGEANFEIREMQAIQRVLERVEEEGAVLVSNTPQRPDPPDHIAGKMSYDDDLFDSVPLEDFELVNRAAMSPTIIEQPCTPPPEVTARTAGTLMLAGPTGSGGRGRK